MLVKIISGAQTGADRAALDAALELGIPSGGWVPKGRYAEDGVIPERYPDLEETPDAEVEMRTEWNIRDSDATLIVSHGPLEGGSLYTKVKAGELGKPWLHLDLSGLSHDQAVTTARRWLEDVRPAVLNIAGPRGSKDPDIYPETVLFLRTLLPLVR